MRRQSIRYGFGVMVALSLLALPTGADAQCPDLQVLGCGDVTYQGCCEGDVLRFCEEGVLGTIDCGDNPSCGWDGELQFYDCGTAGGGDESGLHPRECPTAVMGAPVIVNEVRHSGTGVTWIELKGEPGLDLSCFEVITVDARDGTECRQVGATALTGARLGSDGYFVIASDPNFVEADMDGEAASELRVGPGGVQVIYHGETTDSVVDGVGWGGPLTDCDPAVVEFIEADDALEGESLARSPDGQDSDSNYDDFRSCATPTPGSVNRCPGPQPGFCTGLQAGEEIVINEVLYRPDDGEVAYIELKGSPGLDLTCLSVVGFNGGERGEQCAPYSYIPLWFEEMPEDGYYVIAAGEQSSADLVDETADLQDGPDGIMLLYETMTDFLVLDSVAYGGLLSECRPTPAEGVPAAITPKGSSIARVPDGQDTDANGTDFATCATPTIGAANTCTDVVVGDCPPLGTLPALKINEVHYRPVPSEMAAFIELKGPPALSLDCYSLVAVEGGATGTRCTPYSTIRLDGKKIPADGYFVLAATTGVRNQDYVNPAADLQNGPDALRLVYRADGQAETLVDRVAYGTGLATCTPALAEKRAAIDTGFGESLARVPDAGDTEDNQVDFQACGTPTPGVKNTCPAAVVCDGQAADVVINEMMYRTSVAGDPGAFVELAGPAGTDLSCYHLLGYDFVGACPSYRDIRLSGKIPASGYFLLGKTDARMKVDQIDPLADFKATASAVQLVYRHETAGDTVVDSLGYAANVDPCRLGEGDPHPGVGQHVDESLARIPDRTDSDRNKQDFEVCPTPTPGLANACEGTRVCIDPKRIVINEVQTGASGAFVELKGPAGTDLSCYTLVGRDGLGCGDYGAIALRGEVIPDDGYFVVAAAALGAADLVDPLAAYQAGPDGLELRYAHTVEGEQVVDSLAYGNDLGSCVGGEGDPAAAPAEGSAIARVPNGTDTGDNAADFLACAPATPGAANPTDRAACTPANPEPAADVAGGTDVTVTPPSSGDAAGCAHGTAPRGLAGLGLLLAAALVLGIARRRRA